MQKAKVSLEAGSWSVSWQGLTHAYADEEEAVEQARAILRSSGGGTIELYGENGLKDTIGVKPAAEAAEPPPAAAEPPSLAAAWSRRRAETLARSRDASSSDAARVLALRAEYEKARTEIVQLTDEVEREIGLAALRLEATHTYERLKASTPPVSDADLAPLADYLKGLSGDGRVAEWGSKGVDKLAEKAIKDAIKSATTGVSTGVITFIVGFVSFLFSTGEATGAAIAQVVVVGGGAAFMFFLRFGQAVAPHVEKAWISSFSWVDQLGSRVEALLGPARKAAASVRESAAGAQADFKPFAVKAQEQAKGVLIVTWILLIVGGAGVVYGAVETAGDLLTPEPIERQDYQPTE